MKRRTSQYGVSLVELLVAVAILGIALTPLLSIFVHALKTAEHSNKRTIALNLARDMQEEIRSKAFVEPDPPAPPAGSQYYPLGTSMQPFGLDSNDGYSASVARTKLDDVDDYDGWCRGQDCTCVAPQATDGRCRDNTPLEAYDGTKYEGRGYSLYQGFTRMVQVFNILPNISTVRGGEPPEHSMDLGVGTYRSEDPFNFYDLRQENISKLMNDPTKGGRSVKGRSRLKVIKVIVTYNGPVTAPVKVEDMALVVLPVSKEE